ncbi:TetR/AcrR family transcriptional regulator [Ekhidna sp.]
MKGDKRQIWIDAGYRRFATHGEAGLSVEAIARDLGKNKSSFYHYFGEIQVLRHDILNQHIDNSKLVGQKIEAANSLDPDVLNVILEHKQDFLFHKQLKLESDPTYKTHHEKAYALVEAPLVTSISKAFNLEEKQLFSNALLSLVSDNFLLRIKEANLSLEWLRGYVQELKALTQHVK